jgi:hypothetical protein
MFYTIDDSNLKHIVKYDNFEYAVQMLNLRNHTSLIEVDKVIRNGKPDTIIRDMSGQARDMIHNW